MMEEAKIPIQQQLEATMKTFQEEERWEAMTLFSSEGLPMASAGYSLVYNQENLLEFAFSLIESVHLLGQDMPAREITIRGRERKTMVFKYFEAWDDELIMAAVISGRKGYKRAMGKLIKWLKSQ